MTPLRSPQHLDPHLLPKFQRRPTLYYFERLKWIRTYFHQITRFTAETSMFPNPNLGRHPEDVQGLSDTWNRGVNSILPLSRIKCHNPPSVESTAGTTPVRPDPTASTYRLNSGCRPTFLYISKRFFSPNSLIRSLRFVTRKQDPTFSLLLRYRLLCPPSSDCLNYEGRRVPLTLSNSLRVVVSVREVSMLGN